ncbi:NEDD8-conjugating enzyme UBC12 [Neolecta irregularis DAH-3]|uniref:NEDD8-conjugating enzyme UBC12 n=1 Tax=Neolecta irregularis (strain DAH-3) TaxID=1198029 RepID=A0A1U7LLX4_NEOID|nr:NEDD8-conjugating enzyme UBC12 [Neolecta irregularis DAH-3]|eukprot:OLL23655.1 NEDD8-conjugating enzyme UBC12 [Neolecta irregularis DAH-3]
MLKILSMKKNAANSETNRKPKICAAQLRLQKDVNEIHIPPSMKTHFPNPDDLLNFTLDITPDEGFYVGGTFHFTFAINQNYPHEPPKIYHPNIDLEGNVCLNILREDWKPVLNINAVMIGLLYLFQEPNPDDPLNKDAANDLREHRQKFAQNVKSSMKGGYVKNERFDDVTSLH